MQACASLANPLGERLFDIHVNIFQLRPENETACLNVGLNGVKPLDYGFGFLGADQFLLRQHPGMGLGTHDVVAVEPGVILDGGTERLYAGRG